MIPSIPGFGFSGPTRETGWDTGADRPGLGRADAPPRLRALRRAGRRHRRVRLARAGPASTPSTSSASTSTPLRHAFPSGDPAELAGLTEAEQERLARLRALRGPSRSGYAQIQATRPQTLAYGLTDSPVGQLAWIVEKFKEWTDPRRAARGRRRPRPRCSPT